MYMWVFVFPCFSLHLKALRHIHIKLYTYKNTYISTYSKVGFAFSARVCVYNYFNIFSIH